MKKHVEASAGATGSMAEARVSSSRPKAIVGRKKKVAFLFFAAVAAFTASVLVGEWAVRWYLLGGALTALRSFVVSPNVFVPDRDLGFKLNPEWPGVNSLGIPHGEIPPVKPSGLFRLLVLGDSVAFDPSGFVGIIREELQRDRPGEIEVINASIPGFTTYQELVLLKRDLITLDPDLVILQYCLNDNYRFLHYLDESGRWLLTPEAERAVGFEQVAPLDWLTKSSYLLVAVRIALAHSDVLTGSPFAWEKRPDFHAAWEDSSWPENEMYLTEMKSRLDSIDARFVLVVVPFEPQLSTEALARDRDYTLKPQRRLLDLFGRLGDPILDLFPVFLERREDNLYRDTIHLTPVGHRIVADELSAFLRRNELIPMPRSGR
jgi:lysophospholipase L1-like esterase